MVKLSRISFGGTAAIVTSMGLITGLDAANVAKPLIISTLLIAALADNLTDSLSIHIYQESERLEKQEAWLGTLTNFAARFVVCLTFMPIVALCPVSQVVVWSIAWGLSLLAALTCRLAWERRVGIASEVVKHVVVALVVILVSKSIGYWINRHLGSPD